MKARVLFRPAVLVLTTLGSATWVTEEPRKLIKPRPVALSRTAAGDGWFQWGPIGTLKGFVAHRERITALSSGIGDTIWVGTSHGRLLSSESDRWTLQAELHGLQLTAIAVESPRRIWLSTSDGIRRLESADDQWKLTDFRQYYEGHPSFVSGGYIPGEDAVRLWGYVDQIYMPPKNHTYAPWVVSTEHGLFTWGGYGSVWHHFLPHYWGANSAVGRYPGIDTPSPAYVYRGRQRAIPLGRDRRRRHPAVQREGERLSSARSRSQSEGRDRVHADFPGRGGMAIRAGGRSESRVRARRLVCPHDQGHAIRGCTVARRQVAGFLLAHDLGYRSSGRGNRGGHGPRWDR